MMARFKYLLFCLAFSKISFWLIFIPSLFIFPRLLSIYSTQTFLPGEIPSYSFFIAVDSSQQPQSFELISLKELPKNQRPFFTGQNPLEIKTGVFETSSYRMLEQADNYYVIETIKSDDDYTFTSRYRIEDQKIQAISRRILGPGHGMTGGILAFIFSYALFFLSRLYTKRFAPKHQKADKTTDRD